MDRAGLETSITVKQILVGIQDLLDAPNTADPAQAEGYNILIHLIIYTFTFFCTDADEYKRRVRLQAKQYPPLVLLYGLKTKCPMMYLCKRQLKVSSGLLM
ncbi:SUMO-conjugating enzyme SCE1-like isoform X2 [Gossypium australe]|uniref:SUMO-conjugating enzyme SCE1-like isoform X2 n=1 Tax=Gossypium australe TaxID=47621 RepID=A0A5B6UUF6_9ROSI|nr:SUMO-conjugating enzyme SCE1-like isoform X2 [Gossypium australe]